jgi:hypothetical protein
MNGRSAQEWLDKAARCRERVALYRNVVERAERPGGHESYPRWAEIKESLIELADDFEYEAAEAEARADEIMS